jgi:hypothetical protein
MKICRKTWNTFSVFCPVYVFLETFGIQFDWRKDTFMLSSWIMNHESWIVGLIFIKFCTVDPCLSARPVLCYLRSLTNVTSTNWNFSVSDWQAVLVFLILKGFRWLRLLSIKAYRLSEPDTV